MGNEFRTILLVEDEPVIAMDLADTFADAGWTVMGPFDNLSEAEAALSERTPHAAVLDMNLRGTSSIGLAERLSADGVPFLVLTGDARYELPASLSFAEVCHKPILPDALVARIACLSGSDQKISPRASRNSTSV